MFFFYLYDATNLWLHVIVEHDILIENVIPWCCSVSKYDGTIIEILDKTRVNVSKQFVQELSESFLRANER